MTPAGKGGALWLQPVVQPGQSKHSDRADIPEFGINRWGKDDGRDGRVRGLPGRYAEIWNNRVGQG